MPSAGTSAMLASDVRPFAPTASRWQPLGLDRVRIDGGFWGERQQLNATVMIDHVESWLERMGWIANFDAAAEGRLPQDRRGREFSDSEIYKLLEAMSWETGRTGDPDLEDRLRRLTARVAAAQEEDGYLNTRFGRPGQGARYSDLEWGHELYCYGHLIQAGVARARTSGPDDELVRVAVRAADHVCATFSDDGIRSVCGHPEIETALAELSRVTGDERYLAQARLFLERRGHGALRDIEWGRAYFQDDVPVRDAEVFAGHAVRALYLAAAAVDVADATGDEELLATVAKQTRATLARRTYLTGGMGARHEGESFGDDFQLPPDRSYSETCAGIASIMLFQRLLMATGDSRYADAAERALYNVVAASPAADGRAFFYANTLQQRVPGPEIDPEVASPRAASSLRAPFYEVSCCPTNLTRIFASLGAYLASTDDAGIQLHQYADATVTAALGAGDVTLAVRTGYPVDGTVRVEVLEAPAGEWELTLRVPAWARDAVVRVGGRTEAAAPGYWSTRRAFAAGDVVELVVPMVAHWTFPDPRIDAVRGQVAVERGPIVYALESVDAGADVSEVEVVVTEAPRDAGGEVRVDAVVHREEDEAWPYADRPVAPREAVRRDIALTPYHAWAERGPGTMRVWMPVAGA